MLKILPENPYRYRKILKKEMISLNYDVNDHVVQIKTSLTSKYVKILSKYPYKFV